MIGNDKLPLIDTPQSSSQNQSMPSESISLLSQHVPSKPLNTPPNKKQKKDHHIIPQSPSAQFHLSTDQLDSSTKSSPILSTLTPPNGSPQVPPSSKSPPRLLSNGALPLALFASTDSGEKRAAERIEALNLRFPGQLIEVQIFPSNVESVSPCDTPSIHNNTPAEDIMKMKDIADSEIKPFDSYFTTISPNHNNTTNNSNNNNNNNDNTINNNNNNNVENTQSNSKSISNTKKKSKNDQDLLKSTYPKNENQKEQKSSPKTTSPVLTPFNQEPFLLVNATQEIPLPSTNSSSLLQKSQSSISNISQSVKEIHLNDHHNFDPFVQPVRFDLEPYTELAASREGETGLFENESPISFESLFKSNDRNHDEINTIPMGSPYGTPVRKGSHEGKKPSRKFTDAEDDVLEKVKKKEKHFFLCFLL